MKFSTIIIIIGRNANLKIILGARFYSRFASENNNVKFTDRQPARHDSDSE